jgi:hypothetical protein
VQDGDDLPRDEVDDADAVRRAVGWGRVLSSTPGGAGGDPLKATNNCRWLGLTVIPRGRLPSGTVVSTW